MRGFKSTRKTGIDPAPLDAKKTDSVDWINIFTKFMIDTVEAVFRMEENQYKVDVSWDKDVLWITISGKATKQNASEMAKSVFRVQEEFKPPKVLIDCTRLEGRLSIVETYFHVREYPRLKHPTKRAVLDNPENREFFTFHETTSINAGVLMKYFTDIDKALKWLNE